MIEITDIERNTPLTRGDLVEFSAELKRQFANARTLLGLNDAPQADPRAVLTHEVIGLSSDTIAEDSRRLRLWDLADGGTAWQINNEPVMRD